MSKFKVTIIITECEEAVTTEDRYHNVTTTGKDREVDLLSGTYLLDMVAKERMLQEVTNFLGLLRTEI